MMSNEAPIVVAPRPVRLSQAFFHLQRDAADDSLKLAFNVPDSPRSGLPSEALEEFLSILTPSFMRKPRSLAFPSFGPDPHQQRALAFRSHASRSPTSTRTPSVLQLQPTTPSGEHPRAPSTSTPPLPVQIDTDPRCWPFSGAASALLSSPVSRLHTRNPFYNHHDHAARFPSPGPVSRGVTPLTPAAVPLPSPSPDELVEALDDM